MYFKHVLEFNPLGVATIKMINDANLSSELQGPMSKSSFNIIKIQTQGGKTQTTRERERDEVKRLFKLPLAISESA